MVGPSPPPKDKSHRGLFFGFGEDLKPSVAGAWGRNTSASSG